MKSEMLVKIRLHKSQKKIGWTEKGEDEKKGGGGENWAGGKIRGQGSNTPPTRI